MKDRNGKNLKSEEIVEKIIKRVDSITLEGNLIKDYEFFDGMADVDELLAFAGNW